MGYFPDLSREMRRYVWDSSLAYKTLVSDGNRVIMFRTLLDYANGLPHGHYAEVGTWRGLSARMIMKSLPNDAELYCFDTFEGFTETDLVTEERKTGLTVAPREFVDTSAELARKTILDGKADDPRLNIVVGDCSKTIDGVEAKKWRFVHLDVDVYAPTYSALEKLYPNVVPGGVILMHDYFSFYTGVKEAAGDFFTPLGIVPIPMCDKAGTAVVIKPLH